MSRDPVTIRVDAGLRELRALFARSEADVLPVVARDASGWMRRVAGVVTRADLLRHLVGARRTRGAARQLMLLRAGRAADVLRRVRPLEPGDPLGDAAQRLLESGLAALPVVDRDGRLAGMLTLGDVLSPSVGRAGVLHGT